MATTRISRDSLDSERRGRIIGDDQHKGAIRARTRELLRLDTGRGGGGRRQTPGPTPGVGARVGAKGASREAVLKIVSWTKDSASPLAQARYASRTRQSDPPNAGLVMVNEEGRTLRDIQIEAEIRSWDLKAEADNLSASARRTTPAARRQMPAAERLDKRQAVHMIFSVPSHAKADAERLGRAVDLALGETVREAGFRYVYTIHTDHSARPHAHIVVKAQSEPFQRDGVEKTRQLRLGPKELDAMRQVFTRHAQERGLNVVATRRQDREYLRADILAGQAPLRDNMKFHQAMKQTRQGRTFEVKAPSWYAENGLEYERRRLAAASIAPAAKGPPPGPPAGEERGTAQNAPERSTRGFLGRLFGRALGKSADETRPLSAPEAAAAPAAKRGGYYQNFDNYRNGASPADAESPAEAKITAHFAATHREPEKAAASFQAMLKEAPRLALWAAAKHPQAFGEPTGREGPGIAWREVRPLVAAAPHEPAPRPVARDPHSQDAALAGERLALREATARARAKAAPEKAQLSMVRSLARLADMIERETPTDPESKERASHIRALARDLNRGEAVTPAQRRDQAERIHGAAAQKDKAALYRELEDQLRQRDQARAERRARDREDGGRGAGPQRTPAPSGAANGPTAA